MKSSLEYWSRMKSEMGGYHGINIAEFESKTSLLLDDLAELKRLESEPRCQWMPIGFEQRAGADWIVGQQHGPAVMARYTKQFAWTVNDRQSMLIQPTHYLANIPPVPEPVKAPTAEEWADAVIAAHVARGESETTEAEARLSRLMERHNAATK